MSIKILLLWAGLIFCMPVLAQDVKPANDSLQVMVTALNVTGLAHPARGLSQEALLERARAERTRFGPSMSVDELNRLADALTVYVRSFGFLFHTVFLPPQRVEDGQVELRLQEGVLAQVHVINKTVLADQRFEAPFSKLLGQLVYGPAIEGQVQALKAQPGFSVFAFYSRAEKPGELVLNLRVDEAKQRVYGLRMDNYGSASSGKQRVIGQYSEYQLTGHHDRLDVALLQTVGGASNQYGSLGYQLPFGGLQYLWDISATNNQFELGERYAALGITGDTRTLGTGFTWVQHHQPSERATWRLGAYDKRNRLDAAKTALADEASQALTAQWSRTWASSTKGFASLQLDYSYGQAQVAGLADEDFNKLEGSGLFSRGFGSGRGLQVLQFTGRAQVSDVSLPSIEGMALSGAYGVRGYAAGLFNAEQAALGVLEWRLPNVLTGEHWRVEPYAVAEYGLGRDLDAKSATRSAHLTDVGLGASVSWGQHLRVNVLAVTGLGGSVGGVKLDDQHQVLCELRWQ